jgi:outer membrane protein TolC
VDRAKWAAKSGDDAALYALLRRALAANPELREKTELMKATQQRFEQVDYLDTLKGSVRDWDGGSFPVEGSAPEAKEKWGGPGNLELQGQLVRLDLDLLAAQRDTRARQLVTQVKTAFAQWAWGGSRVALLEQHLKLCQDLESKVQAQVATGAAASADALAASIRTQRFKEELARARDEAGRARSVLLTLANQPEGTKVPAATLPDAPPQPTGDLRPQDAWSRRSELRELALRRERLQTLVKLEQGGSYPALSEGAPGTSNLGLQGTSGAMDLPDHTAGQLGTGPAVSVVRELQLELGALDRATETARLAVRRQLAEARRELDIALRQVAVYRDEVLPGTKRAYEAYLANYARGTGRIFEVLEMEEQILDAGLVLLEARMTALQALARLEDAAARAWW